jgi:hypothetical protein
MFEQLRCMHLRRGDVHRFGPQHIRKGTIRIATEKSGFDTLVMPVHADLIDAINATEIGAKKNCHGVRKSRAEDAAYAGMTESQMMGASVGPTRRWPRTTSRKPTARCSVRAAWRRCSNVIEARTEVRAPRPERTSNISE